MLALGLRPQVDLRRKHTGTRTQLIAALHKTRPRGCQCLIAAHRLVNQLIQGRRAK
jgi:hypothetical protein